MAVRNKLHHAQTLVANINAHGVAEWAEEAHG